MERGARERLQRSGPPLVASGLAAGVLVWLGFEQGGYFEDARLDAAVVLWTALAALVAVELRRLRLSRAALVALGALAGLTAWTALSTTWSADPVRGERLVDLDLLYVALFAVALIAVGTGRHARTVVLLAFGVCVVIVAAAVWARLHPGAFGSPLPDPGSDGYRMEWPLGYWNALGGLAAIGATLAIGGAADPRSHVAVRAIGAAAATLLLVGAYLTFSRGSIVAFAVGLVVLVALGGHRASLVATAVVVGVAVGTLVLRLEAVPALTSDPLAGEGQAAAGRTFTPTLALVMALAAGAQALLAVGDRSVAMADLVRRAGRPVALGLTALVVLAGIGGYVARADAVEGRVANALDDTGDWIDRQWDEFNRPGGTPSSERGSARLDTAQGTRSDLWDVALDAFGDNPLAGEGAGSYQVRFFRSREVDENVQNAHSLQFETLGELGIVGAGFLLAFLGAIVAALVRSRRRRLALPSTQTAAVGAAVAVWLVHASVDWDWQMPVVTGTALVAAATLFPTGRRIRRRRRAPAAL